MHQIIIPELIGGQPSVRSLLAQYPRVEGAGPVTSTHTTPTTIAVKGNRPHPDLPYKGL